MAWVGCCCREAWSTCAKACSGTKAQSSLVERKRTVLSSTPCGAVTFEQEYASCGFKECETPVTGLALCVCIGVTLDGTLQER